MRLVRMVVGAAVAMAALSVVPPARISAAPLPGSTGEFTALTPARILDTRDGTGGFSQPLGPGATYAVDVTGVGGVPDTGVSAVVVNVTGTSPSAATFLTIWPSGVERPEISNVNLRPRETRPNLATVAVGADGLVNLYNPFGAVHVIFDVVGFYSSATGPAGARLHTTELARLFDTRTAQSPIGARKVGPDESFTVSLAGHVPSGATAVVLNVTVTEPTAPSFLTVYPGDVPQPPTASNLNFLAGQTIPNLVTVRVAADGTIRFFNKFGQTHVLADVVGFYDLNRQTDSGRFIALAPSRQADTRDFNEPLGPDGLGVLELAGYGGVPSTGAGAVVLNVTITQPTEASFLTVFSDDECDLPLASNLNFRAGETAANLVLTPLSQMDSPDSCAVALGAVDFYNLTGQVHVIADVFGYFLR